MLGIEAARSAESGQLERAMSWPLHVEIDGGQNDKSLDNVLQREMDAGLVESFVEDSDNDSADERSGHGPDPAGEARAADDHGGDGIEFEALTGRRLPRRFRPGAGRPARCRESKRAPRER